MGVRCRRRRPTSSWKGDSLITQGLLDRLEQLQGWQTFALDAREGDLNGLVGQGLEVAEVRIAPESWLVGKALFEADFRNRFGAVVLVIRRDRSGENGERPPHRAGGR